MYKQKPATLQMNLWRLIGKPRVNWNGSWLVYKEDYASAMAALKTDREVVDFRRAFAEAFPLHTEWLLGYLTGDIEKSRREDVQKLVGVAHPMPAEISDMPIALQMIVGTRWLQENCPEQAAIVMAIPRLDYQLCFKDISETPEGKAYVCPRCSMVSYNPNDVLHGYCGHCHKFHDEE